MPAIAKTTRLTGTAFLVCALVSVLSSPLSSAEVEGIQDTPPSDFDERVRSDRADFGFKAFLEIRGDENQRALRIVDVRSTGAAGRAGLRPGDLVLEIDGSPLPNWKNDLERVLDLDLKFPQGEGVPFLVERGRELIETAIAPDAMPVAVQQELISWVASARATLREGRPLYCHDIRQEPGAAHHHCKNDTASPDSKGCSDR